MSAVITPTTGALNFTGNPPQFPRVEVNSSQHPLQKIAQHKERHSPRKPIYLAGTAPRAKRAIDKTLRFAPQREIAISDVLRSWKTLRDAEAVVEGQEAGPSLFPALASDPCAQDTFRRLWARILDKAELCYRDTS
jgi:hypothetical protein